MCRAYRVAARQYSSRRWPTTCSRRRCEERLARQAPLAARLRPRTLDDVVGQDRLLARGRPLRALIEEDRLSSVLFWGPPGTGKTTLARLIADTTAKAFEPLSAVSASVKDVREVLERARTRLGEHGPGHDPVPRRDPPLQQGAAGRPAPRRGGGPARADRRHHREPVLRGEPAAAVALHAVPPRAARPRRPARPGGAGPRAEGATADDDAVAHLVDRAEGDGRQLLTALEVAVALASGAAHAPPRRAGRRRGRPRHPGAPLRRGRPLRRHLGVHQEHPRLRPGRRAALPRPACSRPARTPASSPGAW